MTATTTSPLALSFDELTTRLYDTDPAVRVAAAAALATHPSGPDAVHRLAESLDHPDPVVREAVASALASIFEGRPDLVSEVSAERHGEGRPAYFKAILRFVACLDTSKALDALFAARPKGDAAEWAVLLEGIPDTGRFATDRLLALLNEHGEPEHRIVIAELLIHRGVEAGYEVLICELESRALLDELIARGPDGVRRVCRISCGSNDEPVADVAERLAVHRKTTEATIRELAATGTEADGATMALETLGHWDDPKNVEILLAVARDVGRTRKIREAALLALCKLEAPEAIETLGEVVMDSRVREEFRTVCATALGTIGNVAALPALEAVARSEAQGDVGVQAREAIRRINE